jgi:uncharacterized protein
MPISLVRSFALFAALVCFAAAPACAQTAAPTPAPDALAAARDLVETMHLTKQYEAILPSIIKTIKPSIVQGRAEVDRQYDALTPVMLEGFRSRLSEMTDAVVTVYASNFSVEELQALTAFYKSPVGQKMLDKLPAVTQQTIAVGAKFGRSVGEDLRKRMIEELRKKGVDL